MKHGPHLSLDTAELPPATEWTPDAAGWCFIRVERGRGYWLGERGAREIGPGDIFALSPLRGGYFRASRIGPVTLHHFRFSPELAGGILTPAEHETFERLAMLPDQAVRSFPATTDAAVIWRELLAAPVVPTGFRCRTELLRIVARLLAVELQAASPPARPFLPARLKLRLLLNEMPEEEFLRLTPRDLAGRCQVSLVQINRSFRQLLGESIRGHQELIRLRRARQALAETNGSLETIAAAAGFRGSRAFSVAFRKRFGVAPLEWRKPRRAPG